METSEYTNSIKFSVNFAKNFNDISWKWWISDLSNKLFSRGNPQPKSYVILKVEISKVNIWFNSHLYRNWKVVKIFRYQITPTILHLEGKLCSIHIVWEYFCLHIDTAVHQGRQFPHAERLKTQARFQVMLRTYTPP